MIVTPSAAAPSTGGAPTTPHPVPTPKAGPAC